MTHFHSGSAAPQSNLRAGRLIVPAFCLLLLAAMAALYLFDYDWYLHAVFADGFTPYRFPFLDWDGVAAAIQCWKEGINVYRVNPCDVLGRPHDYSPLWLRASFIPFGAFWRNVIGLGFAVSFILSLSFLLKPKTRTEAAIFALACTSTMVVFALERANIDVLIFVLIVAAGIAGTGRAASRIASYGLMIFAGLLKFYPLVVLLSALREKPRMFVCVAALSLGVVLIAYFSYRGEFAAAVNLVPTGYFLSDRFGASNLPSGLAYLAGHPFPALQQSIDYDALAATKAPASSPASAAIRMGVFALLVLGAFAQALFMAANATLTRAFLQMSAGERLFLVLGASLVAGCFLAGQNIGYRGIFLVLAVAGLIALRRNLDSLAARTRMHWLLAAIIFVMWGETIRHWLTKIAGPLIQEAFWLVRELLWWEVVAVLLGLLAIFAWQSDTIVTARGWLAGGRRAE